MVSWVLCMTHYVIGPRSLNTNEVRLKQKKADKWRRKGKEEILNRKANKYSPESKGGGYNL